MAAQGAGQLEGRGQAHGNGHGQGLRRQKLALGGRAGLAIALLAAVLVAVNLIAARHYVRSDWTGHKLYALSDKTVTLLRELPLDVQVVVFMVAVDRTDESGALYDDLRELLSRMQRHSPHIHVEYLDSDRDRERAAQLANRYQVGLDDLRNGVVVFAAGERHKYVTRDEMVEYEPLDPEAAPGGRLRIRAWKGEVAFAAALLSVSEQRQIEVCFTADHDEAAIDSFEDIGYAHIDDELRRDNYKTRAVHGLEKSGALADCDVVVVAGPTRAFAPPEVEALEAYLGGGGRLFLLLDLVFDAHGELHGEPGGEPPGKPPGGRVRRVGLEKLAARFGARLGDAVAVDPSRLLPGESALTFGVLDSYGDHPIVAKLQRKLAVLPAVREVRPLPRQGLTVRELVRTSEEGWGEANLAELLRPESLRYDPASDVKGPLPVAVAVEAERGARLVVLGGHRLVQNVRLGGPLFRDYNRDLFLSAVGWLANKQRGIGIAPKTPEHVRLTLTDDQIWRLFWISLVGLPLCALLFGAGVWVRRRS